MSFTTNNGLPFFQSGQPVEDQFNAWRMNALGAHVRSNISTKGVGCFIKRTAGGTTITVPRRGTSGDQSFPFQILQRENPSSPGSFQASVYWNSSLMKSLKPNDTQTIIGLNDQPTDGVDGLNWFPMITADAIWLGTTFDSSGNITDCRIASWGQSNTFDITAEAWTTNAYVTDDGGTPPVFQVARTLLGYSVAGALGRPEIVQCVTTDLMLKNCVIDGRAARYPVPSPAPYAG